MPVQFGHAYHLIDTPARIQERLADILETSNRVASVTQKEGTHQITRLLDQEEFDAFCRQEDVLGAEVQVPQSLQMIRIQANDGGQQYQLYGDSEAVAWGNHLMEKLSEGEGLDRKSVV